MKTFQLTDGTTLDITGNIPAIRTRINQLQHELKFLNHMLACDGPDKLTEKQHTWLVNIINGFQPCDQSREEILTRVAERSKGVLSEKSRIIERLAKLTK